MQIISLHKQMVLSLSFYFENLKIYKLNIYLSKVVKVKLHDIFSRVKIQGNNPKEHTRHEKETSQKEDANIFEVS
jgi:hypothetical protein